MNQEAIITLISISVLLLMLVLFIIVISVLFQRRQYQNLQEKTALKSAYEQEILKSQVEVQNETLQYIGQELHDNIGQLLSVARINLNLLEEAELLPDHQESVKETNEIIGSAISDLRSLSKSFDGDFVKDFGIEQSLVHELQRIRKTGQFQTEMLVEGERYGLGFQTEIILFRICQEILNNALKHSEAKRIEVFLEYRSPVFYLRITDNGKGFNHEDSSQKLLSESGAGLRNIKRRVALLGGTCNFNTFPGLGTTIDMTLNTEVEGSLI